MRRIEAILGAMSGAPFFREPKGKLLVDIKYVPVRRSVRGQGSILVAERAMTDPAAFYFLLKRPSPLSTK